MCNFNKQSEDTKALMHLFMKKAAQNVGGVNFLLELIEALKAKKPNALMLKEKQVNSSHTTLKWNKVVFKDKVDVLQAILFLNQDSQNPDFNILNNENAKKRKVILNTIKTLSPIEFTVTPQNQNDGAGFNFKVFDRVGDDNVKMNPIFVAIFFCSTDFTKKALKYEV